MFKTILGRQERRCNCAPKAPPGILTKHDGKDSTNYLDRSHYSGGQERQAVNEKRNSVEVAAWASKH
jgi:hypothetical protein